MFELAEVLKMPVYNLDLKKQAKLLHRPQRGIYTEIQISELLEQFGTPESDIAELLRIASLQPQEMLWCLVSMAQYP